MLRNLFKELSWPDRIIFAVLSLTVDSIALWWRIGIIAVLTLAGVSLLRMLYTRKLGNRTLSPLQRFCLWAMIAYFILYVVSAIVTSNHAEGWFKVGVKLYFFVLPALCLLSDTSYLTSGRIRALFQLLTATLILRFVICIAICGVRLAQGIPFAELSNWQLDPMGMHHNYLAMYLITALAFLYTCIVRITKSDCRRLPFIIGAAVILVVYLFAISSRSGIVSLALLLMSCVVHLTFFRKKYKAALIVVLFSGALVAGLYLAMPSMFDRFAALHLNRVADDRVVTWKCGMKIAQEHLLVGHGSGDYMPQLLVAYEEMNYPKAVRNNYNAHNQYIETLLETGLVGLVFLLVMFLAPFVAAFAKNRRSLLSVLAIMVIASQCFFESMLNRQMGVQFIALVYCLLILSQYPGRQHDTCRLSQSDAS